jgi:predicted ATP-dependent Lon-type protease
VLRTDAVRPHALRQRTEYADFVASHLQVDGDVRDCKAVERFTTAMLRLVFPDLARVDLDDFRRLCVEPARQARAMIRDQLRLRDPEHQAPPLAVEVVE